jgi:GT2 family glycosyltransferase
VLATGNSLIVKSALVEIGGLDLAFDRGPGADHDLGVRLYLSGHEIVFTPLAIQTHYKAPAGGMRVHGVWWRSRTAFWAPFPPATQIYTARRYYPRRNWSALYLLMFVHARRHHTAAELVWLLVSAPWRLVRAIAAAGRLRPCFPLVAMDVHPQPEAPHQSSMRVV